MEVLKELELNFIGKSQILLCLQSVKNEFLCSVHLKLGVVFNLEVTLVGVVGIFELCRKNWLCSQSSSLCHVDQVL